MHINGALEQTFSSTSNGNDFIVRTSLEYMADKLGFRVKYRYTNEGGFLDPLLSGVSLKSLVG